MVPQARNSCISINNGIKHCIGDMCLLTVFAKEIHMLLFSKEKVQILLPQV